MVTCLTHGHVVGGRGGWVIGCMGWEIGGVKCRGERRGEFEGVQNIFFRAFYIHELAHRSL